MVSKMNAPKVTLGGFFQGKTIYSYNICVWEKGQSDTMDTFRT